MVRDLDVFWEKTEHFLEAQAQDELPDLEPLKKAWDGQYRKGRAHMLAYLDSKRYRHFKEDFNNFLQQPGAGARPITGNKGRPLPHRLRHVTPIAVHTSLARVRAYDEWVTGPDVPLTRLHRLRIECKRLRYTLEFFQEILGPEAKTLMSQIKLLQNHLGDLQDAVVASAILRDFLAWGTWGKTPSLSTGAAAKPVIAPGVATYLARRQAELQQLVETFPQAWQKLQTADVNRLLAQAMEDL